MAVIRRIEPLMLNNKLAVVRINALIDAVAGDIPTDSGGLIVLKGTDGNVFVRNGTVQLHTAVGYASKRILVKSTHGLVSVRHPANEKIDNAVGDVVIPHLDALEFISDDANWWII